MTNTFCGEQKLALQKEFFLLRGQETIIMSCIGIFNCQCTQLLS